MSYTFTTLNNIEFIETIDPQEIVAIEKIGYQGSLEREVVIKHLTAEAANHPRSRVLFLKEARTLASLRHTNIIHIYDAGVDENNQPYMILEKPAGMTLQQRLDLLAGRRARLDLEELTRIMGDMCDAATYAQQHNVLLHDLSPANLILTSSGATVLAGLGQTLPKNILTTSTTLLAYASPERLFGGQVDKRSVVYSLGVLLYHLLSGRLPYEGSAVGIIAQKQNAAYLPPLDYSGHKLSFPDRVVQLLARATAQEPNHRYPDVQALHTAFTYAFDHATRPTEVGSNVFYIPQNGASTRSGGHTGPKYTNGSNGATSNGKTNAINVLLSYESPQPQNGNGYHSAKVEQKTVEENIPASLSRSEQLQPDYAPSYQIEPAQATPALTLQTVAPTAELASPLAIEPKGPLTRAEVDPLTPGYEEPTLQAALPYTTLVPLPEPAALETVAGPVTFKPGRASFNYPWILGISVLGALSVIAAVTLG